MFGYFELDLLIVVKCSVFLIKQSLWSYWPTPIEGMMRDHEACLSVLQVFSACLLLSAHSDRLHYVLLQMESQFHFWLTWLCLSHHECRTGDEQKAPLEYWSILSLEFLVVFWILIFLYEPCFHCGIKLAWARDQTGSDCLYLIRASVKQMFLFVLVFVCLFVNLSAPRYQRRWTQALLVGALSF